MSRFSRRSIPTADRISNLPDPILCNILSLLPTKLATSTSILSKRWKSLYLSVSSLDFDDRTFTNFQTFRDFVYAIMLSHNPNVRLQSFHFKSGHCTEFDQYDINRFVNHAVQSGIQNLNLNILASIKLPLPPSVFNCNTLTVLKLKKLKVVDLPSVVDFPLLKTLVLDLVTFRFHKFLINLLSGCPILEDLDTVCLRVDQYLPSSIPNINLVQSLANLVRANVTNLHIPLNLLYQAESLRVIVNCLYVPNDFGFDKLTKLELVFTSSKRESHLKWKWLAELLNHCPKLQNLTIHEVYASELNSYDDWSEAENVPECLSSQLRTCLLKEYKGTECEFQFAKYILRNSKVLHTMTIKSDSSIILEKKHEMLMRLSLCKRGSASCELVFD